MLALIAAVQPLLIGAVLLWSAAVKLFSRQATAAARRSALVPLVGERRAAPAYRLVGTVELAVAALLLLPPAPPLEAGAAAVLSAGFLGYLAYARRAAPASSCGCLSTRRTPVTNRGLGRAGLLLVAGIAAGWAGEHWLAAVRQRPLAAAAVLLVEAAAVVVLSPELDARWLLPLRRLRARITRPLAGGGGGVPLFATVQQLQQSPAFRQVAALISSDVREHWDDEEWRIVCHGARYRGRVATAVFAVPRLRYDPGAVRVAIVDEATGVTVANFAGARSAPA
ncbi:MauE/DoxX family redox-associated membrane protein [Micromonospora sp. NPDC049559]|uniref:MauE/DoxX family redox-associated membrane protein n=1 Tax=Micromonospora sp. NPDC049559 TaxID=3155923 RepID=UPI0034485413